jgi:hypothetical protein
MPHAEASLPILAGLGKKAAPAASVMIHYMLQPRMQHIIVCDACGRIIQDRACVRLLRAEAALPEEPTYFVHTQCVDRFKKQHDDAWRSYSLDDPIAAWVL